MREGPDRVLSQAVRALWPFPNNTAALIDWTTYSVAFHHLRCCESVCTPTQRGKLLSFFFPFIFLVWTMGLGGGGGGLGGGGLGGGVK